MQLISTSRLTAFRACKRLHYYKHHLRQRTFAKPRPLAFGSLKHAGLNAWWEWYMKGTENPSALDVAINAIREASANQDSDSELNEYDLMMAEAMMTGYDARWAQEMANLTVIGVEAKFVAKLRNPQTDRNSQTYEVGGYIDALVKNDRDLVYIVEHKTTSDSVAPESNYWRRLRMDSQISTYFSGARALGHEPAGCIYDVMKKPQTKPHQATSMENRKYTKEKKDKEGNITHPSLLYKGQRENDETPHEYRTRLLTLIADDPDGYYRRQEVVRLQSEIDEFDWDTWGTARMMREGELANRHPRNPDNCLRFNRMCEYFDVCTGAADIQDESLFRHAPTSEERDKIKDQSAT